MTVLIHQRVKNLNRREFYNKSGIYRIYSLLDNRCYIGSSNNLYKRINGHINSLKYNKSHCVKLQNYYNKHGEENLQFEVLELCNLEVLLKQEAFYIDKFDSVNNGFNCFGNLESPFYCEYTKERYDKLKSIWERNGIVHRDKLLANLEKARQSLKNNPIQMKAWNKGLITPKEVKLKQSKSAKLRGATYSFPVIQLDKTGTIINSFVSAAEAERITGIWAANIGKCCLNKRKTAGKFIWKFK